jgi:DNA-binding HxlR family transcriptional regulator
MTRRNKLDARSACPLSCSLEVIGDRWTMLVLRDLFIGKKRFSEFLESPERISTNILSDRLEMMENAGLVEAIPYSDRPRRFEYELTGKGESLLPVLQELCRWGNQYLPDTIVPPDSFMRLGQGTGN